MLFPVILSGGFGGRLWPVSRLSMPKQFIPLVSEHSLIQETLLRLKGLENSGEARVVCNEAHRFIVAEQLRQLDLQDKRIFLEPVGRNTAPAIAVTALDTVRQDENATLLVMPSDHVILDVPSFHKAVREAVILAEKGYLLTFGILPTAPKTGYGYIRKGSELNGRGVGFAVDRFVEKPDEATAVRYVDSRQYFWNSGIFVFKAGVFLDELARLDPEMLKYSQQALANARDDRDYCWLDNEAFSRCPSNSIDYAVMEKTDKAAVVPVNMGWSDVGSWGSFWEITHKDPHGNVTAGNVFMKEVNNCLIHSKREIVATLGIDNLIIVDTDDALLVAHMDKEQEVKDVFRKLM